jgi:DNA repair exonuclease SbcCD ATPase subunit
MTIHEKEMAKRDMKIEIDALKEILSIARWLNSRLQDQIDNVEYWVEELEKSYNRLVGEKRKLMKKGGR